MIPEPPSDAGLPRVVVIGAGFGGLWATRALADAPVRVTLLDRHNFHTFYPLLYQIGAAEIDATDICYPVRKILRKQANASFRMAEVRAVDLDGRTVRAGGRTFPYDHLIVATGSDPHYFGVEGAAEHAFPLREVEHGEALRNHVLRKFEEAEAADGPPAAGRLDFTIVGGGPTGVEYAGALAELVSGPIRKDYPVTREHGVRIRLLEAQDRILSTLPEKLGAYARQRLEAMGVEVRLEAMVEEVGPRSVRLSDGTELATDTVVWTAGVRGSPEAEAWELPVGRGGRVEVDATLQVPGRPEVQVVGDLAGFRQDGDLLPMIAPVAVQQGEHAARNVARQVAGEAAEPFVYDDPGMLATIGRNHAVAQLPWITLTGFPAWVTWVLVHIAKLIGFRNRLVVLVNWAWDYFTYERFARLILPGGGDRDAFDGSPDEAAASAGATAAEAAAGPGPDPEVEQDPPDPSGPAA
jgi:NADH dehydrogenase